MDNLNSDTDFDMEFDHNKERPSTPMALVEAADKANQELLPAKSKDRYMEVYNNYQKWKASKGASSDSERVVTAYISELATSKNKKNENLKPSTLWARYSMLRATLNIYEKTDISKYATLTAFLKRKSDGYVPTKATVFTESEIQRFLDVAADEVWLDVKTQCASLRITDCNQLAREWSREAILADDVCSAQCGFQLQGQSPGIPGLSPPPSRTVRSRTFNPSSFSVPDFSFPDLTQFIG